MNHPAKNIFAVIACVVALFIPSYIAIANYVSAQYAPVDEKTITKLEITDVDGNLFELPADDSDSAQDIAGFVKINDRSIEQTSLPEPLVGTDFFEFKYYSYDRTQVYKYYFSENPNEAYYVDANGTAYHIDADDAAVFLSTRYARCLYDTTAFPVMTVSGEQMIPAAADWAYKTYSGDYVPLTDIQAANPTERVYAMKGAFALSFDNDPDYLNVTISDGGNVLFSDSYANVANISLEGKTVDVTVDAKWYETDEQSCYGSATYKFKARILLPAVFYLGKTEIEPGEFVVISAKNVDDPAAVTFASEPDIGFKPTFFADGNYARALVPVGCEFEGKEVKFTCSYGEVTQEMTLDITPKTFRSVTADVSPTIVSQTRTESTINAFNEAMAPIVAQTASEPLWEGTFLDYKVADGYTLNCGFGLKRTISATGATYRHQGVDYVANPGKNAYAVNSGTVVYVGYLDLPGYMVVVDHGLGLKSWYCHLGSTAVNVGDVVQKGDIVGYVGATGFTARAALHLGLSVYDVPVCIYDLWEEGIVMTD